jgi:anti-sigma B factor antagonist
MRFEESKVGDVLVAKVLDTRIAADVAPRFKAHLSEYIGKGSTSLVLDLAAVTFIDSSGLGALVSSLKAMGTDSDLVIAGAQGAVASMFKLTRMDKVFRMYATVEEAASALAVAAVP